LKIPYVKVLGIKNSNEMIKRARESLFLKRIILTSNLELWMLEILTLSENFIKFFKC